MMKVWISIPLFALLLAGCAPQQPAYRPVVEKPKPKPKPVVVPEKPTKVHELKEVQDDNFDPEYMYPETPKKRYKEPETTQPVDTTPVVTSDSMSKEECIGMIGQAKFDKYTQMLGSEAAAIKRCVLLKSMK
jgi:PBP1b-binding outer membrane lipoprotein LpoB